jgi:hypothetical protein
MQDALLDTLDGTGNRRDSDACRIFQELLGKFRDGRRHGGREQQRLSRGRQFGDDPADIGEKAHVEHAVGFVEHKDLDAIKPHRAGSHEVDETARRCDQNVDPSGETADLAADRDAADGKRRVYPQVAPIGAEAFQNLPRKLAGRAEYQHAAGFRLAANRRAGEPMQNGKREGRGLSGARLRNADHVPAGKDQRNGLTLDRCGDNVTFVGERAGDRCGKAEIRKRVQSFKSLIGNSRQRPDGPPCRAG